MIWLRLIWYVFWRGLVLGAIEGLLFGTLFALIYGLIFDPIIGALLGGGLGLINGLILAGTARWYSNRLFDPADFLRGIHLAIIPLDVLIVLAFGVMTVGFLGIVPAIIAGLTVYHFSFGFAEYADSLMTQIPSRKPPVNVLS